MADLSMKEDYICIGGETEFELNKLVIKTSLSVFINGLLQSSKGVYTVDDYILSFNDPLTPGDIVSVVSFLKDDKLNISVIDTDSKVSLFKRYAGKRQLVNNAKYILSLFIKGKQIKLSFTSRYSPLYTTAKIIRQDCGELLDNITDDVINRVIYDNSIYAKSIYDEKNSGSVTTTDTLPTYINRYVRYKTDLDLVNAAYLSLSGKNGSIQKNIGPINIIKSFKLSYVDDMMKYFKNQLAPEDSRLKGRSTNYKSFVKANSTSYPINERMSF